MAKISFTFSGCSWRPFSLSSDIDVTSCFLGPAQAGPCIWGDRAVFRVQVQEAKVPPGDRLELVEVAGNFTIWFGDFAQDFAQGLDLLAELTHVVLEVAFAHAHSPSNRHALKSPHFPCGFDAFEFPLKPPPFLEPTDLDLARLSEQQRHHSFRLARSSDGHPG